jgi:ubiquinone/menaquinone biosynthesis C-methylase UbiE
MRRSDGSDILGRISGGRVLDVATGGGLFIIYLRKRLKDYDEIVGIDSDESAAARFTARFGTDPRFRFEAMDALELRFPDATFDTVGIGNALCEFGDPSAVLREMLRVVRGGGHLIVTEAYRDQQSAPTRMHVDFHDWWVAVQGLTGSQHQPFRARSELIQSIRELGLLDLRLRDVPTKTQNARDAALFAEIDELTDQFLARAEGHPMLQARGETLRRQMHDVGFLEATTLLAVGRKRRQ